MHYAFIDEAGNLSIKNKRKTLTVSVVILDSIEEVYGVEQKINAKN